MNVPIVDVVPIRGRTALGYGREGVVVMYVQAAGSALPVEGEEVVLEREDGWLYRGVATDVRVLKDDGTMAGFFVEGLELADVPVHTRVRWGVELWPAVRVEARARVGT